MATTARGHIEQLPSGSFRVHVYAGTDPVTGKPRRLKQTAAYREAAGITNPDQAVSLEPHSGTPELEAMRKAVFAALEIRDEADVICGLDRGELEARSVQGPRARAAAPPDVSSQLRLTAQAEADTHRQSADVQTQHDHVGAASATVLAAQLAAERQRLEADNARYEKWSTDSRSTREEAGKAEAELQRRGNRLPEEGLQPQLNDQAQIIAGLRHDLGADIEAPKHPVVREHQAVIDAGEPWPPHQHLSRTLCLRTSRILRRARKMSPCLRRSSKRTGRRGWTSC